MSNLRRLVENAIKKEPSNRRTVLGAGVEAGAVVTAVAVATRPNLAVAAAKENNVSQFGLATISEFVGRYPFVKFTGIPAAVSEADMRKRANEGGPDNHENNTEVGLNFMASPGVNITHNENDPNIGPDGSVFLITPLSQKELDEFPKPVGLRQEAFATLAAGWLKFSVPKLGGGEIGVVLEEQENTGYYVVVKGWPVSEDPKKPNHIKINVIDGDTTNASATRFPSGQFIELDHVLPSMKAIKDQVANNGNCADGCAKGVLVFVDASNGGVEVSETIGKGPLKIVDTNIIKG